MLERVAEREIEVELSDDARTLIGNLGYDPTYGARPLKRVIQKRLVDPLALAILEGRFAAGDTVTVEAVDGELVLERAGGDVAHCHRLATRSPVSAAAGRRLTPRGVAAPRRRRSSRCAGA